MQAGDHENKPAMPVCVTQIRHWLNEVPDPEIPVISIVDLGIVRDVQWDNDTLVVTVTPTYTGCPATRVINEDIEKHLRSKGITKLRLQRRLSPAWTTAWLTEQGREKLQRYGIAAPLNGSSRLKVVTCPRCQSQHTEKISQFGSTPCKASYRCCECLEPFDYFKCI